MVWSIRQSISLCSLAACLATGMAAHAAGESTADRLKAQLGAEQNNATTPASPLQQLGGSKSSSSSIGNGSSLLGGALGGSAASGALGASALSSLGLPDIASGSASNVAGVLEYCIKNNYLKKANINTLKDGLLSKAGLGQTEPETNSSYASGLSGMLTGGNGQSFNLNSIQDNIKEKACDYVLENATSLL